MSGPALATFELTKDYAIGFWRKRPYRALDRLTMEVREGEVFGFLGPNGAGKTTTLKLLMQLVFPTAGRAENATPVCSVRKGSGRPASAIRSLSPSLIYSPHV